MSTDFTDELMNVDGVFLIRCVKKQGDGTSFYRFWSCLWIRRIPHPSHLFSIIINFHILSVYIAISSPKSSLTHWHSTEHRVHKYSLTIAMCSDVIGICKILMMEFSNDIKKNSTFASPSSCGVGWWWFISFELFFHLFFLLCKFSHRAVLIERGWKIHVLSKWICASISKVWGIFWHCYTHACT